MVDPVRYEPPGAQTRRIAGVMVRPLTLVADDPDEYRATAHGARPYDWTRKDG